MIKLSQAFYRQETRNFDTIEIVISCFEIGVSKETSSDFCLTFVSIVNDIIAD